MENTIDSFLSDEEPTEPVAAAVEVPAAEAREVPRDEHGRFAPKGVEEGAPPAPQSDRLPQEEYKALRAEREKRQSLEQELALLRQQANQTPPAPPPSVFEDEQGAFNHFGSQVVSTAVQQATLNAKLDMSEMMVRQANPDFEDIKAEFLRLAEESPALRQQALADPHPWAKAYQIAKNHKAMQEIGATDLESLKAKMREEIMAEMQVQTPARPGLPPSITGERNVGSRGGPAWSGPSSLSDLLS